VARRRGSLVLGWRRAGGAGGRASGHQGIVVELEDGAAAPDEDPRRPVT
jgi:hypothetical protein